ncbi:hypothetical protein GCM10025875_08560 [Litorihabitans aurantiacus]|uniref:Uncharacterized protein n=1 Tax=Litorihabitans aurantiacus TaxID=1930061 RepID=A0AA37UHW4_9MICO|nr:hypothetical protein GCM10025875_08560 [Litorihabitans aurantiacus]
MPSPPAAAGGWATPRSIGTPTVAAPRANPIECSANTPRAAPTGRSGAVVSTSAWSTTVVGWLAQSATAIAARLRPVVSRTCTVPSASCSTPGTSDSAGAVSRSTAVTGGGATQSSDPIWLSWPTEARPALVTSSTLPGVKRTRARCANLRSGVARPAG